MRKGLDGDDDDRLALLQRFRQLFGFGALAFVSVDASDHAFRVLELVDRVLKLSSSTVRSVTTRTEWNTFSLCSS